MSVRPPKPITLQNTFGDLEEASSDDGVPQARTLGEVSALNCQSDIERRCQAVIDHHQAISEELAPLYKEMCEAQEAVCREQSAAKRERRRPSPVYAKRYMEVQALIDGFKAERKLHRPAAAGANSGSGADAGQHSKPIASCQAGDAVKNNPGQGFRGHPWGVSTFPRVQARPMTKSNTTLFRKS